MSEEDRCIEIIEERDMLADENKKFAEFLSSLGYNLDSIVEISRGATKDEIKNKVLENLYEELTEQIVGDNSEGRYNHEEIIQRVNDLLDIEQRFNNVLSKTILDKLTELGYDCEDFLRGYDDKDYPNETE